MTGDLIAFLKSRYDDDEQLAKEASPGPWRPNAEHDEVLAVDGITVAEGFALSDNQLRATVDHIAYWDPDRALAEVDANRRILDWCQAMDPFPGMGGILAGEARKILKWLALPYASHPDYRSEWAP